LKAERTFHLPDLLAFAELSGDYNPLHTDPIAARRTQFGECVTHGVFVLLWALDALQSSTGSRQRWTKMNAKFLRPVVSGLAVTAAAVEKGPGRFALTVSEQGRTLLQCDLAWLEPGFASPSAVVVNALPPREVPQSPAPAALLKTSHRLDLYWSEEHGKRLFPALAATQSLASLAALLASTRVIGMKVPGEHSIFLQINLCFSPTSGATVPFAYHVSEFRQSSQRLAVSVEGSDFQGVLWALVRPAPVVQPSMQIIKARVPDGRFAGHRVIVVGGSRGLGEVAAKILAAGGADVAVSYRVGHNDAQRVVEDICAGGGKAFAFQLDTGLDAWDEEITKHCSGYDHLCFFATPPIAGGDGTTFSQALFQKFNEVYVFSLVKASQALAKLTQGAFALFNASSVYVEEPPIRNLEYAASKAASEACCRWLRTAFPKSQIHIARFPPLSTDQTASFITAHNFDTVERVYQELSSWINL
jgi:NAD(P)-dependent dehydrogenase (short-subunit alcohol dehydrogenase family)/acyl dehydratase